MNVTETLQILQALQACGATHFKSNDFEISIDLPKAREQLATTPLTSGLAQTQPSPIIENKEATEKLQDLIKTMQLSPEELLDVVMPAGAGG